MTNLEWAIKYRGAGWSVFPCQKKAPLVASWTPYQTALPTEDQINEWWTKWPEAQIAVACGWLSGITVIDYDKYIFDPATKAKIPGPENPLDLMYSHVFSMTSLTGKGGAHVFCKYAAIPNSAKSLHPQIDVKSHGGYVILPPSIHHETGTRYAWDGLFPFTESNLKVLSSFPQSLLRLAETKSHRTPQEWAVIASNASVGSRNTSLAALIGKIIRSFSFNEIDAAWVAIQAINKNYSQPLEERELLRTFQSITKRHYGLSILPR